MTSDTPAAVLTAADLMPIQEAIAARDAADGTLA